MKKVITLIIIVSAFAFCPTFAQEKRAHDGPVMKRPEPGPERARLSFLVGNFTTKTRILPSPMMEKEALGTGTSIIAWGLDSMFLTVNEQSINPIFGNYKGYGMLGYDPQERQYTLSMFNNFGDQPQYRGNFAGDTLLLVTKVVTPGGSFEQTLQWFREGSIVRLRVLNNMGQGFLPVIDQAATPSSTGTKK
jgi:hypothetical protein